MTELGEVPHFPLTLEDGTEFMAPVCLYRDSPRHKFRPSRTAYGSWVYALPGGSTVAVDVFNVPDIKPGLSAAQLRKKA